MLTDTQRHLLTINALEDIAEVGKQRQTLSTPTELNNIILHMERIAYAALKRLELGMDMGTTGERVLKAWNAKTKGAL